MDAPTLEALKKSIAHWDENAKATDPDKVSVIAEACALCDLFYEDQCHGCPVSKWTGQAECQGTPWVKAYSKHHEWKQLAGTPNKERIAVAARRFRLTAEAEAEFLRSLLPPEESSL